MQRQDLKCHADVCSVTEKSRDREKRKIVCQNPGCSRDFHASCIGYSRSSDKEISNIFFVCSRCETFLKYSADIAQKALLGKMDKKLDDLKESIYRTLEERLAAENQRIIEQTKAIMNSAIEEMNLKLSDLNKSTEKANETIQSVLKSHEAKMITLESVVEDQATRFANELQHLKSNYKNMEEQLVALDATRRKNSFIIRNFPEDSCSVQGKTVKSTIDAVSSIADALGLGELMGDIRESFRIGQNCESGRNRLIMVKATERARREFLRKARTLKNSEFPLNKVFINEDLPPAINKRLAAMRKRAYEHRTKGEEAFVRNKKLYVNGVLVDEIPQNF